MNHSEFIKEISSRIDSTDVFSKQECKKFVALLTEYLDNDVHVLIPDFGSFGTEFKDSKIAYNPHHKAKVKYPPKRLATFTPAGALRQEFRFKSPENG